MNSIKESLDYRDYLREYYEESKKKWPYFSYRYMAQKVGVDASHLVKIFQKQRHVGKKSIESFIRLCGLSGGDAEYFVALVHFNKAKTARDSKLFFEKLMALRGVQTRKLSRDQFEFYTKWYYSAILTLLDFYTFSDDYEALAAKMSPPISVEQAKEAVSLLERLALIRRERGGNYYLTDKLITTGDHDRSAAVTTFQQETIRLAGESLERHPREKRDISTVTITISESNLDKIHEIIKNFRETMLKFAKHEQTPDKVYQLNVQLFPLTD